MDLGPYVESLRQELLAAAEPGQSTALAQRLASSVASATRLTMLDILAAAMDEVTKEMAPDSVEVRLRGRDPAFVVTRAPADGEKVEQQAPAPAPAPTGRDGAVSRINFRPPEQLKQQIEAAAGKAGLSTNAWLIRVASAALVDEQQGRPARPDEQFTGWVS